jgi:fatty-acyl-CoA synthase
MNRRPDYVGWPPMHHMAGSETVIATILNGGTFYIVDGLQIERILECLAEGDVTHLQLFPATIEPILEHIETHEFDPDVYDVEIVGSMADLHKPEKIQRITTEFEADFLNSFGTTETGITPSQDSIPMGVNPSADDLAKSEVPNCQVRLVDEDWNEVDRGEIGELAIRGPTLFSGYINNEDANREALKDGWFRLGDLFVRTDDGLLQYKDRRKYLIKSGGENIYPAEIERILADHPGITEAVVVKQPDHRWGEVPYAYVATGDNANLDEEAVLEFLRDRIASYKLPKVVEFVEEERFPRNTTGKVVRSQVEEWTPDKRNGQE